MEVSSKLLNSSSYHVWILDSSDDWVLICGTPSSEEVEPIFQSAKWAESSPQINQTYQTCYDTHTGSQLFIFETESPESISVRAKIHLNRQLSQMECDHFVLQARYVLLRQSVNRHWQEHDSWLKGLNTLTSTLDLDELLHNIMHNALIAIPAVDTGFLTLYDPETQKLTPKASIGLNQSINEFKTDIGEGIAGKVFMEGTGCIYNQDQASEAISNLQEENYTNLMNSLHPSELVANITTMAVPVRMNDVKLGVMIVHQIKKKRKLNKEDLRRLQGFADQAAIAITNARLFSELRETNEHLIKRNQIHDIFTKLLLKDTDLIAVIKTAERLIGLPVYLYDLTKNEWYPITPKPLASSDFPLSFYWENRVDSWTITGENEAPFYFHPVVNEGNSIGYFVVELHRPLKPLDQIVLEQGGALVALMMVNTYSLTDMYYKRSYEFFNELLQYRDPNLLTARCREFKLSPEKPLFVTYLQVNELGQDMKKREVSLRRLISTLHKELGHTDILLFGFHDKITIILHAKNEAQRENLIQKMNAAVKYWSNHDTTLLQCGIGRLYTGLEYVMKSSEEASKSLMYLTGRGIPGFLKYENIGINRLFLNQQTKDIEQFIQEVLSPLQSPKAKSSDLEMTLKTYITANRSTSITAEQLHIHPNTLYHRIRKIEELLNVDLNAPNDWLTLLLACHLSESY
ncbi:helix-turn-helix domain-containing protein [Neobacillus sp. SAB-20_R2A]|uniref:helix-turn-helix domain-containing protein n=1 Tax=Neobacillus sp. SAB-20_R2A TaxID=3120519 RepID=UPI003C6E039B